MVLKVPACRKKQSWHIMRAVVGCVPSTTAAELRGQESVACFHCGRRSFKGSTKASPGQN